MLTRFITIISLLVLLTLLVLGSTVEPALIKSAVVFFALTLGFNICRFLITVIQKKSPAPEQEPSPSQNSA